MDRFGRRSLDRGRKSQQIAPNIPTNNLTWVARDSGVVAHNAHRNALVGANAIDVPSDNVGSFEYKSEF